MAKTNLRPVDIQYESEQPWFNNDRWTAEDIGLEPDIAHSTYYIKFCYFSQPWFKRAIKRFVLLQSATKSFSSCKSYAVNLAHFSRFLADSYPNLQPHEINRKIIIDYLTYLNICGFSVSTRSVAITHLKTFHTIILQEKWLPLPFEPLIHNSDTPKSEHGIPRYIPEDVIKQLKQHLTCLPQHMKNFITVLLETGRRISEICAMPYDCLERDNSDGFFLRIHDKKLRKQYLIPISVECVNTIKEQQNIAITIAQRKQPENTPLPTKEVLPTISIKLN